MTNALFFYGTLRHLPLLEVVLGRPSDTIQIDATQLDGYAVYAVAEEPFPTIQRSSGASAKGVLVSGLTDEDVRRLDFYEGGFDYDLIDVTLVNGAQAQMYICAPDRWATAGAWDFDAWTADWASLSCHAAREVMGHYGVLDRKEVAEIFGQIRGRAWSKVLAERSAPSQGVFRGDVEIIRKTRAYTGYFAVDEVRLRHTLFDGGQSDVLDRSYFVAGDAALVLPYDPQRDCVLVVEQMRMGPLGRGDAEIWHLEPIAGRIDPGETGEQAALREAMEEAGLTLDSLETVARGYSSPGDSTGFYHIFVGVTELPDSIAGTAGLVSEDENIRSRLFSFEEFIAMAERQALANTPLTLLAYWLAHHRSRLRSAI
ncbi:NUDIX domain-containing protein [uncultured Sulfitobacter sp.]|uniref:NUDIX domain-containing protein n=1 Tax=uncultured Sulfitobacter sp. TaxID=191468 RepID=UPI00261D5D3C|nr:NUDIX domain-containing protein [uncultured Sulfitobacter sp.]